MRVSDAFRRVQQGGLAAGPELTTTGLSRSAVARAVREGRLRRVARGLYATGPVDAHQRLARVGVLSHTTAAALWGLDLMAPAGTHVTVPRNHSRSRVAGVSVHRADLPPDAVTERAGLPASSPLRTVLDCLRLLPRSHAVVLADSALRAGLVAVDDLRAAAAEAAGPGSARVRRAVALTDPLSGSALETLLRLVLVDGGIRLRSQVVMRDRHGVIGRVDFLLLDAPVVVEADGFAYHADRDAYRTDRRRTNALVAAGYRVLRFSWEDVVERPEHVLATVRATLEMSAAA